MKKKAVSIILAAAMLLSLLAFQAFAEEAEAETVAYATIEKDNTVTEESDAIHLYTEKEVDEVRKDEQRKDELSDEEIQHFLNGKAAKNKIDTDIYVPRIMLYAKVTEPTVFHITIPDVQDARLFSFPEKKWIPTDSMFENKDLVLSFYMEESMPIMIVTLPADAAPSPIAAERNARRTAALPEGVCSVNDAGKVIATKDGNVLVSLQNAEMLSKDQQAALKEALEALPGAVTDGFSARYFFYAKTAETYNLRIALKNAEEASALKFVDGKWEQMETKLDTKAGNLTIMKMADAPVAILAK